MHDDIGDLYHAGYRRLVAQAYAFTTDLSEAQDAVQEAFARALARPRGFDDIEAPEAWLRTVAINVVRRRWRRKQILNTLLLRERPLIKAIEESPEPERADLRNALATLPRNYREVIVLHYLADLPVDEVAAILEVPVGTVKSRLSRGREALKGLLDDVEAPPLSQVRQRARTIRTRRQVTKAALAVVFASAIGFFLLRPAGNLTPVAPPTPSTAPSYSAEGITIHGIFDPLTVPDLPGTIVSVNMISATEGWLRTSDDDRGMHRELHTVDGGQTWIDDPSGAATDLSGITVPGLLWRSPKLAVGAAYDSGVPTVYFGSGADKVALQGAGDGITGTVRTGSPSTVVVMTLQGNKITGVYQGEVRTFRQTSDGGGMTISGEPILLPDGRLLVADAQSRWQVSSDGGATWRQAANSLPNVGSLHASKAGYVALDLFRFGWVAISPDGLTWQKLAIR